MRTDSPPRPGMRPHPAGPPATAATMRAAVQNQYGPPSVLAICEVDVPVPGRGDVLVQVAAASIHPGDYFVMTGEPYVARLAFGLHRPRPGIRGMDLAGVVVAVAPGVTDRHVGEEVFGWTDTGALAEYACVPAKNLLPVPANVSLTDAAATPTSGMTALQALRDVADVQAGQAVLITGASGGVGSFAVQIAKALGAEVTGVCSTSNVELVRSLGAHHVIDYTSTDFTQSAERYDVIVDSVEAQPLAAVRRVLTPTGTLIPNSGRGGSWLGPIGRIAVARAHSAFTRQRLRPFFARGTRQDLQVVAEFLASGTVKPVIAGTYRLDGVADAFTQVGSGHTAGKVVIALSDEIGPPRPAASPDQAPRRGANRTS